MHAVSISSGKLSVRRSLVSIAVATALFSTVAHAAPVSVRGVVGGTLFTPPVNATNPANSTASVTIPSVYAGATVCFDLNNNGVCDAGEPSTTSSTTGGFALTSATAANVIAVIPTTATNGGQLVAQRNVFRTSAAQVAASKISPVAPASITITPLTTELVRMMENDGLSYSDAVATLSERIGVESSSVTAAPTAITDPTQLKTIEAESVVLTNRFGFAAKAVDRGDYATIPAAQQGAMNLEGIPRYDHIFIVMLENKSTAGDVEFALRAQDQRVPGGEQRVHELLRHGQPERAELHGAGRRRRLRYHRRQPVELRRHGRERSAGSAAADATISRASPVAVHGDLHGYRRRSTTTSSAARICSTR